MATYTERIGGKAVTNHLIDELRKDLELAGVIDADMAVVDWALRNLLATAPALRRRAEDADGVVFTEHPTGCWVMEADPDSYRRLIDTWATYDELKADVGELTELEPAPTYTEAELPAS